MAIMTIDVKSTASDKTYQVRKAGAVWTCTCTDHVMRSHGEPYVCKHIAKVAKSLFAFTTGARVSDSAQRLLADAVAGL